MELAENEQERQQWEASIAELCDACLVDWDDTGSALVMLQPVKEGFFLLAEADEVESCILQWCSYYAPILEQANNRHVPNRQDAHTYVVEHLPQLFHLLKRMLAPEWQEQLYPAIALFTQKLHNYFQFSTLQGLDILKKLLPFAQQQGNHSLEGLISKKQADLLRRTGQLPQALDLYAQAESLYRQEQANLGLANTLKSRADLLSRTGKLQQALDLYAQAETLFRQEQDNLGLANTLRSRAFLYLDSDDDAQAPTFLFQALPLYESEQEPWGIALTCALLSKLCPLFEKQAHQAPAFEQRAREIAETLPPNQKEIILSILNNKNP